MKKLFVMMIAVFALSAALQGCAAKPAGTESLHSTEIERPSQDTPAEKSTAATETVPEMTEVSSEMPAESSLQTEAAKTDGITPEMALAGISRYCGAFFGAEPAEGSAFAAGLELKEETESEYQLEYRSYTGAVTYFYVDKESGETRTEEYVPALGLRSEGETFALSAYLGDEPEETAGQQETADPDARNEDPGSRFIFQPKVCPAYMTEVFGAPMCEAWYALVDAVMAGEDDFACPDQETYNWIMGQFPGLCFPVLLDVIDYAYDRENSVISGRGSFTWKMSKDDAAARIAAFSEQIEGILNEAMKPEYTDFEKVLALYDYFSRSYDYDYEMAEQTKQEYVLEANSLRFFKTGKGICSEIAPAFSYLLLQAGVEATVMSGNRSYDHEAHEWSYVRIGGRSFHVDPTYVIADRNSLAYFMMTDAQRFAEDGYDPSTFYIVSHYAKDHPHPAYTADDDSFAAVWAYLYDGFDPAQKKLFGFSFSDNGERKELAFDYTGF